MSRFSMYLTVMMLGWASLMGNASEVDSKPLLHPLFADHAVLQRDSRVPVWGWAQPGATIIVSFAGQKKNTTAATDGKWMAYLDPMPACKTSRTLKVQSTEPNKKI